MSHNPQNTTRLTRQHRGKLIAAGGAGGAHSDTSFVVDGTGGVVLFGVSRDKALELVKAVPDTTLTAREAATGRTFAGRGTIGPKKNGRTGRRTALANMTPAQRRAHRAKNRAAVRKLQDAHEMRMMEQRADRRANKSKKKSGGEPKKAKKAA